MSERYSQVYEMVLTKLSEHARQNPGHRFEIFVDSDTYYYLRSSKEALPYWDYSCRTPSVLWGHEIYSVSRVPEEQLGRFVRIMNAS